MARRSKKSLAKEMEQIQQAPVEQEITAAPVEETPVVETAQVAEPQVAENEDVLEITPDDKMVEVQLSQPEFIEDENEGSDAPQEDEGMSVDTARTYFSTSFFRGKFPGQIVSAFKRINVEGVKEAFQVLVKAGVIVIPNEITNSEIQKLTEFDIVAPKGVVVKAYAKSSSKGKLGAHFLNAPLISQLKSLKKNPLADRLNQFRELVKEGKIDIHYLGVKEMALMEILGLNDLLDALKANQEVDDVPFGDDESPATATA